MTLLFSEAFRAAVAGDPFVLVDAGARGGLEGPWAEVPGDRLVAIAFEPDPAACAELAGRAPAHVQVVPEALWSQRGTVSLHVARSPSTSSVHPPHFGVLERFAAEHGEPRRTAATVRIATTSVDEALAALGRHADFLKIDTHGAEHEILSGARAELEQHVLGVLVETWTTEIHRGQRLCGDVMVLMRERGLELFDVGVAAAWRRRSAARLPRAEKRQVVGLDLLFLREPSSLGPAASLARSAKAAAIADLYGFPDLASEQLDLVAGHDPRAGALREELVRSLASSRRVDRLPARLGRRLASWAPVRLRRWLRPQPRGRRGAALHYS